MSEMLDQMERQTMGLLAYAMARLDQEGIERHASHIPTFEHNPYRYLVQSARVGCEEGRWAREQVEQKLLPALLLVHPYATAEHRKELRFICEGAMGARFFQAGMWFLDQGARMTNQVGSDLFHMAWADPSRLDMDRVGKWTRSPKMKVQEWKHQMLAVLAFAGADNATLDEFHRRMGNEFQTKLLAWGVARGAGMEAIDRAMGRGSVIKATAQSLGWLNGKLKGKLWKNIEALDGSFDYAKPAYRALMEQSELHHATPGARASTSRPRI